MVKAGQGGAINKFVDNVRSGHPRMGSFTAENLSRTATDGGDTAFDVLMDAMSHIPTDNPKAYGKAFNQLAARNASNIRGVFGEGVTFKRLKLEELSPGGGLRSDPDSLVVGKDVNFSSPGQQGVDIEGSLEAGELISRSLNAELAGGRPLFVEVKAQTSRHSKKRFLKQTEKHISTNVADLLVSSSGRKGEYIWEGGQVPHLHYELMGEGFVSPVTGQVRDKLVKARIEAVIALCEKMVRSGPLSKVKPAFVCAKDISFNVVTNLISPLTLRGI